jgi:hypothetical protein
VGSSEYLKVREYKAGFAIKSVDGFDFARHSRLYMEYELFNNVWLTLDNNLDPAVLQVLDRADNRMRFGHFVRGEAKSDTLHAACNQ